MLDKKRGRILINFVKALYTFCLVSTFSTLAFAEPVPAGLLRMGDGAFFSPYAIVVDKSVKKIYVIDNSSKVPKVLLSFESDVGKKPGPKHALNDHKTPEGVYFFNKWIDGSELDFEKYGIGAFVSNYPNFFDTREGRGGYGIWLHAIADKVGLDRGSRGCVVVRNDTLEKIKPYIVLHQTPILIFDKISWVEPQVLEEDAKPVVTALSGWKKAWENKEMDSYIGYYSETFKSGRMNKNRWKAFKTDLASRYNQIKIDLSMPVVFSHGKQLTVKFFQNYSSNEHSDFGEKTLYMVQNSSGAYEIVGEEWAEAPQSNAKQTLASSGNKL